MNVNYIFDLEGEEAQAVRHRMEELSVWPDNPYLQTKSLKRQLRGLRSYKFATTSAKSRAVNGKSREYISDCYWRDVASKLCQDHGYYDWKESPMTGEQVKAELLALGVDITTEEERMNDAINRGVAVYERRMEAKRKRELEELKRKKLETLMINKCQAIVDRYNQSHDLKMDLVTYPAYYIFEDIKIVVKHELTSHPEFRLYIKYKVKEDVPADVLVAKMDIIAELVPMLDHLMELIEQRGHQLMTQEYRITVIDPPQPSLRRRKPYIGGYVVTEGEEALLAERLNDICQHEWIIIGRH